MSTLKVAGIQLDIAWEDPGANFRRVEEFAAQGAHQGARLLVLPEMFATGFSMEADRVTAHGEEAHAFLRNLARQLGVYVAAGLAERCPDGQARNACTLVDPGGKELLRYYKIHPFSLAGEDEHFAAGDRLPSAAVDGVRVTPLICYDLRFPEPFRIAAEETDLFLVVANWPDPRIEAWSTLLRARAIENQTFVLGVNRQGDAQGFAHSGRSALVDPLGGTITSLASQPGILVGSVSAEQVAKTRKKFGFLKDRRPDVYDRLDSPPLS